MADWVAEVSVSKSYDEVFTVPAGDGATGGVILYDQKPPTTTVTLTAENTSENIAVPTGSQFSAGGYSGLLVSFSKSRTRGTNLYTYKVTLRL